MNEPIYYKTASELSLRLQKGEISSWEIMQSLIERTEVVEAKIQAFLQYDPEDALTQARTSDARRARGESRGPLDGVPVAVKDVIAAKERSLTCGSRMLENFISPYDATSIRKLKEAGAILWGRLNMDEFAMGSSTENSAYKRTFNPWDVQRVPGGSSGGSAAAVAAGESILALGTDTGGSIRQPAAFCGIVGMKPTYGLVSRYGLVAFASSLDQIGPMGRSVEDAALLLQVIAGHDRRDSTSLNVKIPDYRKGLKKRRTWTIGVPSEYFTEGLDSEVRKAVEQSIEHCRAMGCEVREVSLEHTDLAVPIYYVIATAEASSNLARYDGVRYTLRSKESKDAVELYFKSREEGFGEEVKRRIILGTYVLSSGYYDAYYLRAQKIRTLIRQDFMRVFEEVDALITPTTPTVAFKQGEKTQDPLAMYLNDIYTISLNLAGLPGISIPCGFTGGGLPIGVQLVGKPLGEGELLALAHALEERHGCAGKHPVL